MEIAGRTSLFILAALCLAALLTFAGFWSERSDGRLKIYFLDVGQGDAIYLRSPNGRDMLIDGGPSDVVLRKLSRVMPWYDRSIDVMLETHPDADHIGGLPEVLRRYKVGVFMEPGIKSENAYDDEIAKLRRERGVDDILARSGMKVDFGDGASFDVLFPDSDPSKFADTNSASIVGQARYGSTSAMLTGDSPKWVESRLVLARGLGLASDLLKAGHHGSRTSSGEEFVRAVSPHYAIISAGKNNRYGHPHKEVIELFESLGVHALRTDLLGTLEFVSDGAHFFQI